MKIVIALSAHAEASLAAGLRPNDRRAVFLARALPGQNEVTALLAGDKDEAGALVAALAAGADRAVRIACEGFAGVDFHTLGQVLARAVRSLSADLVLMGARSDTEELGAVSASVARHLGAPHVANIESLEPLAEAERPAGSRATLAITVRGGGRRRRLAIEPPIVLSVAPGADPGPVAAAGAELAARIEVLSLADPEATVLRRRTEILGTSEAAVRSTTTVASAAELVAALTR